MKNLTIKLPLVDGSEKPLEYRTGKELIDSMCSDDISPPPRCLILEVRTRGKSVTITIPYDLKGEEAFVSIQDS